MANQIPTYTPVTITNVTKALTGWTYGKATGTTTGHNATYYLLPMVPVQANHDTTAKALFPGYDIAAGQTADKDFRDALQAIFTQPFHGHQHGLQLCRSTWSTLFWAERLQLLLTRKSNAGRITCSEFQLYSTQTASLRANLVNSAVYGGRFDAGTTFTTFNIAAYTTAAANLIALINTVFFHNAMSDSVKTQSRKRWQR